jgi:hypothetical protein
VYDLLAPVGHVASVGRGDPASNAVR